MSITGPLVDSCGRLHTDLRISVTDRCNIRCAYCMPAEGVVFRAHEEILRFEEIERFVRVAAKLGVRDLRLTGGEPLVRRGICDLVGLLAAVPDIDDLALTTNAILLPEYAEALKTAGLRRLNISLDTLNREKFEQMARRDQLDRVIAGIDAALDAGFEKVKLNALAIRDFTEEELVPLTLFARSRGLAIRFIEFMPADGDGQWQTDRVLGSEAVRRILTDTLGPLEPVSAPDSQAPASEYRFVDGGQTIGLIGTVTEPFCERCNRLRLTAEGSVRNCLFSPERWDARAILRGDTPDDALAELILSAVAAKKEQHGNDSGILGRSDRPMYQIGG